MNLRAVGTRTLMTKSIAIDGLVASGKTAVGMALASRLGSAFLDTGVMYRAVTWAALCRGVGIEDEEAVTALARTLDMRLVEGVDSRLLVDGADVTDHLRSPAVDGNVSRVAGTPGVRDVLIDRQRAIAAAGPIVMAGRDIGSVVLPGARVKLYLQASVETRAKRRLEQRRRGGSEGRLEDVVRDIERRDCLDAEQSRPARDATIVETDGMGVDAVVALAMALWEDCR